MSNFTRPASRLILSEAMRAVHYYDGRERAYDRLIGALDAFEQMAGQTDGKDRDHRETAVSAGLRRTGNPITVDGLLSMAIRRFEKGLASGDVALPVVRSGLCFLPAHGRAALHTGSGLGFEAPRIDERCRELIQVFNRNGIFTDDLVIHQGRNEPGMMRAQGYTLIQLPRHDREVLVCDEVGNASFVGKGIHGPIFWVTYDKEHLKQFPEIERVINDGKATALILDLVLTDNPIRPKSVMSNGDAFLLTEDVILIHALRYASRQGGLLPSHASGDVEELPGQKWSTWNDKLRQCKCGLKRQDIKGVAHLFQIYGLKIGRKENPTILSQALETLERTGHHGLMPGISNDGRLTEDMILIHGLRHAERHRGHLPNDTSGPIETFPGQNWAAWNSALNNCRRGLERQDIIGLSHLFQIYRLKIGSKENPEVISRAIETLKRTGHHGLTLATANRGQLTEDMILAHALRHAERHGGQLPSQRSGAVEGLPGQNWTAWDAALVSCGRGLERRNVKSLAHLFQIYGLKIGQQDNSTAISSAFKTLEHTGNHELVPGLADEGRLTEDLILIHSLRYAARNNGQLPSSISGPIEGLVGQNWSTWNQAVRGRHRGLERQDLKGLPHLFRIYGLKIRQKENPEAVSCALVTLERTGHHGLVAGASDESRLTEDMILIHALRHVGHHNGRLPNELSGPIKERAGQNWRMWSEALLGCYGGLKRERVKSLSHFFEIYGLKTGRKENTAVISRAIETLERTGHHGLVPMADCDQKLRRPPQASNATPAA